MSLEAKEQIITEAMTKYFNHCITSNKDTILFTKGSEFSFTHPDPQEFFLAASIEFTSRLGAAIANHSKHRKGFTKVVNNIDRIREGILEIEIDSGATIQETIQLLTTTELTLIIAEVEKELYPSGGS